MHNCIMWTHSGAEGDFEYVRRSINSLPQKEKCLALIFFILFLFFFFRYRSTFSLLCIINCMPSAYYSLKIATDLSSFTFKEAYSLPSKTSSFRRLYVGEKQGWDLSVGRGGNSTADSGFLTNSSLLQSMLLFSHQGLFLNSTSQ